MIKELPKNLIKLYENESFLNKLYVKTRWNLSPFEFIESFLPTKGRILDVGCGYGILSNLIAIKSDNRFVKGVDISEKRINIAKSTIGSRKNITFEVGDVRKIELDQIGAVTMTDFIHHLPYNEQRKLIFLVHNKLKKGGILIVQEINPHALINYFLFSSLDHIMHLKSNVYFRKEKEFKCMLEDVGFKVNVFKRYADIVSCDIVYVCQKG